jgi:hypothetical protein
MEKKKFEINKEKVEKVVGKVDETMSKLSKEADSKVLSKMKGMEAPILLTVVAMLLMGMSPGILIVGAIVLAVTTSPKWLPSLMSKMEKKKEEQPAEKKEEVKTEEEKK